MYVGEIFLCVFLLYFLRFFFPRSARFSPLPFYMLSITTACKLVNLISFMMVKEGQDRLFQVAPGCCGMTEGLLFSWVRDLPHSYGSSVPQTAGVCEELQRTWQGAFRFQLSIWEHTRPSPIPPSTA